MCIHMLKHDIKVHVWMFKNMISHRILSYKLFYTTFVFILNAQCKIKRWMIVGIVKPG